MVDGITAAWIPQWALYARGPQLKISSLCNKVLDLQRKAQLMSSFLEPEMQAIISHYSLLSFRSDELCIHLSIVGLAETSIRDELWGETVNIRQSYPASLTSAGLLLESCSK